MTHHSTPLYRLLRWVKIQRKSGSILLDNQQTAEDIQDALKDLLGGTIKEMMEAEMDDHLGYEKSELVLCQEKVQIKHAFFMVGLPCQSFCFFF